MQNKHTNARKAHRPAPSSTSEEPIWVVCHHFHLVWTSLHFVPCSGCIETVCQDVTLSSSSAFKTMSSAKRKLLISHTQMLTLLLWSFNASHIILCRKMLKTVGESRHPYQTPNVVLNQCCHWPGLHSGHCHKEFEWLVWCWRVNNILLTSSNYKVITTNIQYAM